MENQDQLKTYFAQQSDILMAILFGSMAKGVHNVLSDIDVAVYLRQDLDELTMGDRQVDITCDLMKLYKKNEVDVVVLNAVNPLLKFQVVKYGQLIYARDELFYYHFKARTFSEYQDIKPMYDMYTKAMLERIREKI